MRPILVIIGLIAGALVGAKLATMYGGDYLAQQTYESPDEQSNLYFLVFVGGAVVCALVGAFLSWLLSLALFRGSSD